MKCLDFDWQIDEFMVYCRSTQLREKTMNSYEQSLRLFEWWCAEELKILTVDKVTEPVIRRYITDLQKRGKYTFYAQDERKGTNCPERRRDFRKPISVVTINNYIRNLRVFFNWLERDYTIKRNPMKKIRLLKVNRQAKLYFSDDEFRKLISRLDRSYYSEHRDYMMILLMMDSGMRLGECSCLLMEDVDLARRRIHLKAEITKGRKDRTVYFSAKTESALRRWLQFKDRYSESDYLFPVRERGGHIEGSNFIGLDSMEESLQRIANRVKRGGHYIATEDVQRRFEGCWKALASVLPYCDEATFYDNDNGFREVAIYRNGELLLVEEHRPKWILELQAYLT